MITWAMCWFMVTAKCDNGVLFFACLCITAMADCSVAAGVAKAMAGACK